jgi:hypothetical protein
MQRFTILLAVLVFNVNLFTQETTVTVADTTSSSFKPNVKPGLTISKCKNAAITIDGNLSENDWSLCSVGSNFCEIEPDDNTEAPAKTEVRMLYDDFYIYFAFTCYDNDMSKLRVNLSDRDYIWNDDYVGAIFDTYSDDKQGYEVFVNPYGIQGDALWTPSNENDSYDMVFTSDSKIYNDRWTVEIAVPFKSIRFPNKDKQQWKVHFIRNMPRDSRVQMSWAQVSRDDPSFMGQAGFINGINGVKSSKNFEILPYVIGGVTGYISDPGNPDSKFKADSVIKGDFGIGLRYGFTSNLTGELVYNPDFSQVESDAAQVDVNSSSALFYNEKRPFFLESSSTFSTYVNVVYTRMINKPYLAAKLTGKVGDFEIGYIGAYDKNPQFIIPYDYGSDYVIFGDSVRSLVNVLRVKKSLKGESFLGLIMTDRELWKDGRHGSNTVFGIDGNFKFLKNWYFIFQGLGYHTKELKDTTLYYNPTKFGEDKQHTLSFDGESFTAFGGYAELYRQTRNWNGGITLSLSPPGTRRDVGFVANNNFRTVTTWHNFNIYPQKSFILRFAPAFNAGLRYDYNNRIKEQWFVPNFFMQFKNLINMDGGFLVVNNENYEGVYHTNVNRGWINFNINTFEKIRGGCFFELGKYIVRFENPSYVGYGFTAEAWLTLKPINRLSIENNYTYAELSKTAGGEKLYAGYILRNKTSFQFTRHLFLRLVTQYDSFSKRFDIDPLFSYKWNPFTIFYIGSTHDMEEYNTGAGKNKFVETSRQFFAKFQYLFRL